MEKSLRTPSFCSRRMWRQHIWQQLRMLSESVFKTLNLSNSLCLLCFSSFCKRLDDGGSSIFVSHWWNSKFSRTSKNTQNSRLCLVCHYSFRIFLVLCNTTLANLYITNPSAMTSVTVLFMSLQCETVVFITCMNTNYFG